MAGPPSERHPIEMLAEDFAERLRRGEHPSVGDYAKNHPKLAEDIRELFPTIATMEQMKRRGDSAGPENAAMDTKPPERLGDFRILREVGRGGMGIVYEAEQASLKRHVAVKILSASALVRPTQLQRFRREAQTAANLHHTNIVPVFGVGQHSGFHYIVMQLIRGIGLDELLGSHAQTNVVDASQSGDDSVTGEDPRTSQEVQNLVRTLIDEKFEESGESGHSSDEQDDGGRSRGRPDASAAGERDLEAFTITERVRLEEDTHVHATGEATRRAASLFPLCSGPWRSGREYWQSIAAIIQQAADALEYAHAQGTLHRDIKPGNLLIDAHGVVWITDFGLAKTIEDDKLSRTGDVVGTLRYMAPEQLEGQVDARSDIYGLGLTLYELATLQPAYDPAGSNLYRKVTQTAPQRPRKVNARIPRDLETIVLKATARDPGDRYQSAGELATDLRCFLEDRPIQARRANLAERLWRWTRRSPLVASLTFTTAALLVLVAAVATTGYFEQKAANDEILAKNSEILVKNREIRDKSREIREANTRVTRALKNEREALTNERNQHEQAEKVLGLALEVLDKIYGQFSPKQHDPLVALVQGATDTEGGADLSSSASLSPGTAQLLENMLTFYDRLAEESGHNRRLRLKAARANSRVGDIHQHLGESQKAAKAYLRAVEIYRDLEKTGDDVTVALEKARIHNELGFVYPRAGDWAKGREAHEQAIAVLESASRKARTPELRYELAKTYYFFGQTSLGDQDPRPHVGAPGMRPGPSGREDGPPLHPRPFGPPAHPGGPPGGGEGRAMPPRGGPPLGSQGPPGAPMHPPRDDADRLLATSEFVSAESICARPSTYWNH